jgi:putative endopeptidase
MVRDMVTAYGRRIDALTWMSPATKGKGKEKLATLKIGVGYPETWPHDSGLAIARGDAFGNFERAELFEYQRNVQKPPRPTTMPRWAKSSGTRSAIRSTIRAPSSTPEESSRIGGRPRTSRISRHRARRSPRN